MIRSILMRSRGLQRSPATVVWTLLWTRYKLLMTSLKIASLNVRSLKSPSRRAALFSFLETLDFDVCLLQECAIENSMDYNHLKKDWNLGLSVWSGSNEVKSDGVGFLFRGPHVTVQHVTEIMPGRVVLLHMFYKGLFIRILNVYASPDKQERAELLELLPLFCVGTSPLLVGGDFNCVFTGEHRHGGDPNRKDRTSCMLKNFIEDLNLKDAFKLLSNLGFTWSSGRVQSRIDFIFLSEAFNPIKCDLLTNIFSDHQVLWAHFEISGEKRVNTGLWRLNVQLLDDPLTGDRFRRTYQSWQNERNPSDSMLLWWEGVKPKIKDFFIKTGKIAARKRKQWFYLSNVRLQALFKLKISLSTSISTSLSLKAEIKKQIEQKGKEIIFNSHVQHLEEGEKCSRFFFKKVMAKKELISSLNGKTNMNDILNEAFNFYQLLFNEKCFDSSILKDCLNVLECNLSILEQDVPENSLKTNCYVFLKAFRLVRHPVRMDCLLNFIYTFGMFLKMIFLLYKEVFTVDILPPSWRRGIVSLIFKKGDKESLENYRPITLLNVDYKVLAKMIALRFKPFIENIIHANQVCGVPGRSMTESLNILRDVIWYCKERSLNLAILSLYFEKAFDRVSHFYLFKVLEKMAVPDFILNCVKVLYKYKSHTAIGQGAIPCVLWGDPLTESDSWWTRDFFFFLLVYGVQS
uniref:Reverse transcriptase domain-containing protein n=1 Tax=Xenopus tropicalis TaxID=8364 RepID=A0A803J240_XENTR